MAKLIIRYGVCNTSNLGDYGITLGGVYKVIPVDSGYGQLFNIREILTPDFTLLPIWFHKVLEDNPNMTAERLYKELKPCLQMSCYKDGKSLYVAFPWVITPQGWEFWCSLNEGTWKEKSKLIELELAQAEAEELRLKNENLNKLLNELSVSLISEQEEKVILKEQVKKLTMKLSDIEKMHTKMSLSIRNLQGSISNFNKEVLYALD